MASVIKTMRGVMKSGNQVPMECGDLSDSIGIQKSESRIPNGGILFPSEFWILDSDFRIVELMIQGDSAPHSKRAGSSAVDQSGA